MRISLSASKHGVEEADIRSALRVPLRHIELDSDLLLVIGAGGAAQLLEIVMADVDEDDPRVIHAMRLRAAFQHYLGERRRR